MTARGSSGRASFIAVVSGTLVAILLVLVVVKFLGDRSRRNAEATSAAAAASAANQVADERAVAAARQKYRRELRFCEALRQFEGADVRCLGDFAAEYGDRFFCGEVSAAARQDCIGRVAQATADVGLCDQVSAPELKRDCYFRAAIAADPASCQMIGDVSARKACIAIAKSDASGCEDIAEPAARHACFHRLAVKTANPELCEDLRNRELGEVYQHALFACWKDVAVATRRLEDCDRIPHESVRINTSGWNAYRECRDKVGIRQSGAECRDGPVDLTCRGKTAAARNDRTVCEGLRSYTDMDLCALTFAFRKNDGFTCGKIRDERLKEACLDFTGSGPAR